MYIKTDDDHFYAEDQIWDDDTLKKLKTKEKVIYKRGWLMPIRVNHLGRNNTVIEIGKEDDGVIWFHDPYFVVNRRWVKQLIDGLQEALGIANRYK